MQQQAIPTLPDAPPTGFQLSDDECVQRLALLLEHKESKNLDEIVALMGRLAVSIEL